MRYIAINRSNRKLSLTENPTADQYAIPTKLPIITRTLSPLESIIYEFLYEAQREIDERRGLTGMEYKLAEPDPWMIAIAYLMWQGIVQGMTWDGIKWTVRYAVAKLSLMGLAPTRSRLILLASGFLRKLGRIRPAASVARAEERHKSASRTEIVSSTVVEVPRSSV